MTRNRLRSLRGALAFAVAIPLTFAATSASADELDGRQRYSGFQTCPAGQQVGITSHGIGTITVGWTTGGGPNAQYESKTFFNTLSYHTTTYTHERALTWYIEANPPGGHAGYYGLGSAIGNSAFCA